ncbi:MAG: SH3 domain-containing protein [Chloroflexota bacterium]
MLRKPLFWIVPVLMLLWMPPQATHAQDFFGDGWQAQYFDNANLSGTPVLSEPLTRLDLNFGDGSPGEAVPSDNFSAIFTTNETFQAGTNYEFVAEVDEGVRVIVGGATLIDQFNSGPGTYSAVARPSGTQEVRVEYREGGGNASIRFFWRVVAAAELVLPPGALAATVVEASVLVVRDGPGISAGRVTTIRRGETYAAIGRDPEARWFLLDLGTRQGWAFGFYLFIDGNEFNVPVVSAFDLGGIEPTDVVVRSVSGIRLRAEPNIESAQIGRINWGDVMVVTGRSEFGSWYQVVFKDTPGWIFAPLTEPVQGDINSVPVLPGTGRGAQAANPDYDITGAGTIDETS